MSFLATSWFDLLQTAALLVSFSFTAASFSLDVRTRKTQLYFQITKAHRDIWENLIHRPELFRITDPSLPQDIKPKPEEKRFVLLVLNHLSSVHEAIRSRLFLSWPGLEQDILLFFQLPIPKQVLDSQLRLQNPSFRKFLQDILIV